MDLVTAFERVGRGPGARFGRRAHGWLAPARRRRTLVQIQDILGHESPTTTKMIYVDVAEEIQRDAMDRLNFLFEDPEE
jgi:integrase